MSTWYVPTWPHFASGTLPVLYHSFFERAIAFFQYACASIPVIRLPMLCAYQETAKNSTLLVMVLDSSKRILSSWSWRIWALCTIISNCVRGFCTFHLSNSSQRSIIFVRQTTEYQVARIRDILLSRLYILFALPDSSVYSAEKSVQSIPNSFNTLSISLRTWECLFPVSLAISKLVIFPTDKIKSPICKKITPKWNLGRICVEPRLHTGDIKTNSFNLRRNSITTL